MNGTLTFRALSLLLHAVNVSGLLGSGDDILVVPRTASI